MRYTREASSTGQVTEYWWGAGSAPEYTRVTAADGTLLWEFKNCLHSTGVNLVQSEAPASSAGRSKE